MPADLTERQKSILDAVVREYVATAEPVASADVVRKRGLPFSSATVRNDLSTLDEAGYLEQPHTSAGRVPTDRGYRFFINHLMEGDGIPSREDRLLRELGELSDMAEFARRSARLVAALTHQFVVSGFPRERLFYKAGVREVVEAPEFADAGILQEFGVLADAIEDELLTSFDPAELEEPVAFVGTENPIRRARRYGMIVSAHEAPFAEGNDAAPDALIALIGPKRMDYEHHVSLLRHMREILAE